MAIKQLNPYLTFNGTADKAIKHYERALDAKVESAQRFGEVPGMNVPPDQKNRVMHAVLRIGSGTLMLSDSTPDKPVSEGGSASVVLDFDDPNELTRRFDALAAGGGKVTMPVADTFWGAKFGMLTDAYGVQWMLNCTLRK
jgi:PhnB protein